MKRKRMEAAIRQRFAEVAIVLDERGRRLWAAAEAKALGYGGISVVARGTRLSRPTIHAGLDELKGKRSMLLAGRARRLGAGRKSLTHTQPRLPAALDALVEPDGPW